MTNKLLHYPFSHLLIILSLGTLAYANSFGIPFVFDDLDSIVTNDIIRDLGNYLPGGPGYAFVTRRWVGYFTFALNYRFGGLNVTGYHLFNLAVHLGAALLVYLLVCVSFRTPFLAASRQVPRAGTAALLAALFFVVHPVQTQAVTYIFQRLASLCTLFYLLALVLYVIARLGFDAYWQQERNEGGLPAFGWRAPLLLSGSVVAAVAAMFTKEIAFTLPLAALLFEFCFFRGPWRRRALVLLPLLLTLAIIPVVVLTGNLLSAEGTLLSTRLDIPRPHYLLTQMSVIITYLRLLILPVNQNLDYDYPVYTTFFTPPVFLSFLLLAALFAIAIYLFWRTRSANTAPSLGSSRITDHGSRITDRDLKASPLTPLSAHLAIDPSARLIAFGIFWFFLTLSIEAGLVPLADVIFEHRLYLPSIGLAMALAVGIVMAAQKTTALLGGRLPLLAAAAAIVALTAATWQRNQVWQSEIRLWEDVTRKSPGKARPWYNLGTHLTDAGRPAEAITALLRAVKLDPQYAEAWHNLGRAYLMTNRVAEAVAPLRTAVRLKPDMDNATVNLSAALINSGKPREAMVLLERNLHHFPNWPQVRYNLGVCYVRVGNLPAARGELTLLRRLDPKLAGLLDDLIHQVSTAAPPQ
jgi:Tfp pilus assembly protein PilF